MSTLEPGQIFADYTIEELLDTDDMGEVYVAHHPGLARSNALRVFAAALTDDDSFRTRFEHEVDVLAGLSHPALVKVLDHGIDDSRYWIAYELIGGENLGDRLEQGPLDPQVVARYVAEIASALDTLAASGVVHRQVQPTNILIDQHDRARLTDFGLDRLSGAADDAGLTIRTVTYAAPELLQGYTPDPRADQYSLAATAYALLTGAPPFATGNAVSISMAHILQPVPAASRRSPHLPPAVDAVLAAAMAKNPTDRFPTSRSFADALTAALGAAPPRPTGRRHCGPDRARLPRRTDAGPREEVAHAAPGRRRTDRSTDSGRRSRRGLPTVEERRRQRTHQREHRSRHRGRRRCGRSQAHTGDPRAAVLPDRTDRPEVGVRRTPIRRLRAGRRRQ
ncbi:protein kinase [Gordonia alkaliphila]|uniref:non-specific serine/threonine protein kinase n=1 Tax=Gordonia alkaliphila TaxID=1053547 RepID=A0ABP8ZD62_9ACTN|nr:serine/threonine-protein kinase [Gordonia alkaliphila]MCK0438352.1 protein kinase [Gordonia alkaliphila]